MKYKVNDIVLLAKLIRHDVVGCIKISKIQEESSGKLVRIDSVSSDLYSGTVISSGIEMFLCDEMIKDEETKSEIRTFTGGAIRDTSEGKLDYVGFQHPVIEKSFADYMHSHRKMPDGTLRSANNWFGGFGKDTVIQSLVRHTEDLRAIYCGYVVYEERHEGQVFKHYLRNEDELTEVITTDKSENLKRITEEDCLNSIKFNCNAYMLETLNISKDL